MTCQWIAIGILGNLGRFFATHILGLCMKKWNSNTTMGGVDWVKISNDAELATMFAKHKEQDQFKVRLQVNVVVPTLRSNARVSGSSSQTEPSRRKAISSQNSSVHPKRRGGSTSVGNNRRVPTEVEVDADISGDDEERLYSDVIQNLRRASRAVEIPDDGDYEQEDEDEDENEEEDLPPVQWDPKNPQLLEGTIFASMSECRNAVVSYCIKAERAFIVDKSDKRRYTVHCVTEGCKWRMHASKMRKSLNIQVKVNPFTHTCEDQLSEKKQSVEPSQNGWQKQ